MMPVIRRPAPRRTSGLKSKIQGVETEQVWCVIDGDYQDKINNARRKADANGVRLAVSTPCFEYWVLLHFEDNATPCAKCIDTIRFLKKHVGGYQKGVCDFDPIVVNVHDAVDRAEQLRTLRASIDRLPENHNPCSEIYLLIKNILAGVLPPSTSPLARRSTMR
jgi:hypothetical protein